MSKRLRRLNLAMPGEDRVLPVDQHRVGEPDPSLQGVERLEKVKNLPMVARRRPGSKPGRWNAWLLRAAGFRELFQNPVETEGGCLLPRRVLLEGGEKVRHVLLRRDEHEGVACPH
jgi:hypothetical protein